MCCTLTDGFKSQFIELLVGTNSAATPDPTVQVWSLYCSTPIVHNKVVTMMPILLQNAFEEEVKLLTFYEISPLNMYHLQIRVTEGEACVKTAGHWPVILVRREATQALAELVICFQRKTS